MQALFSGLYGGSLSKDSPHWEKITEDTKSFYSDVTLSGSVNVLNSLLKWAPKERVLYDSELSHAMGEAEWSDAQEYEMDVGMRKAT